MPSSYSHQIPIIVDELVKLQPKRVLDIGVGRGKYGLLAREYGNAEVVDGVEGDESYITPYHEAIYDELFVGDIRGALDQIPKDYDVVLMIDVIEHMSKEDGHKILQYFKCPIIVSTPAIDYPQEDPDHPLENHVSKWTLADFKEYNFTKLVDSTGLAWIVVVNTNDNSKA